jgi:F0F1-type ATP synthase gamma subunit
LFLAEKAARRSGHHHRQKSRDAFRKRSWKIVGEWVDVTSRADLAKAREIAAEVMKIYESGAADSVYLI